MESWKQGLKAVAFYRDGCKRDAAPVDQPDRSAGGQVGGKAASGAIGRSPSRTGRRAVRKKLPDERQS